jgi:hypothetical protein
MHRPELHVKLPPGLPSDHYEGLRAAVSSLLELWGMQNAHPRLVDQALERAEVVAHVAVEGEPEAA